MAGFRIEGNTSANVAEVDSNNCLKVNNPTTEAQAGYTAITVVEDSGSITGSPTYRSPSITVDRRVKVAIDTPLDSFRFAATTQNTGKSKYAFTTMTCTQSGGFLNINPAKATVSGNYAYWQTWRHYTIPADGSLIFEFSGLIDSTPPANQNLEAGLFLGSNTTPTDGVYFRLTSNGLEGILNYNGTETSTGVFVPSITANTLGEFTIIINQQYVKFVVNGVLGAIIDTPAGNAAPFVSNSLPICVRMRNTNTVTGGFTTKIGFIQVYIAELVTNSPLPVQLASRGDAYQGGDGDTQGSLAIYSNSALATAAAIANATAAAGNTGLGGAALVLPTLTAGTDGILFSYQNPVGSVTQPPKNLIVTGVTVAAGVQTVLAGGPLNYVIGAAFGHTAVSLATAETGSFVTATTKAPRRRALGVLNAVATAAAGTDMGRFTVRFTSPIVVFPGQFFAITARNVGTVTTTGAVIFTCDVDHYFE